MPKNEFVIVVSTSEDGDVDMRRISRVQLTKNLNTDYYGKEPEFVSAADLTGSGYRDLRAKRGIVIIDGDIIVPTAIVTRYEI